MIGEVAIVASLAAGALAPAGGDSASPPANDEIVVTGERIPRSLRETPSSVAVITADDLAKQPDSDRLENLLDQIPNVTVGTGGFAPTIRGQDATGVLQDLPAFLGGTRPRVTVQVDGRAVGYNEFVFGAAPMWDVRQVEVFRTPQTTTQGRNSIAGAIFIQTEEPTYQLEARGRILVGSRHMREASAVVSGPLIENQLALRVAGDIRVGRPASVIGDNMAGADPNHDDFGFIRTKLLIEPESLPWARLEAGYTHSESKMPQIESVREPFHERRDPLALYGVFKTRVDALTLLLDAELGDGLSSTTTLSGGKSYIRRFAPPGLGETRNHVSDASFETLLHWHADGRLEMTGGVHHLRTRLDQDIDLSAVLGLGTFEDRQRSWGLFGEATFQLAERLSATAGLRYQHDLQDRGGTLGNGELFDAIDFKRTFTAWLPKLSMAYDFSGNIRAGILVQRAYNPGGMALNFITGLQEEFEAETLWGYEMFARADFANGLGLSANIFYQRIRDAQRAQSRAYVIPGQGTAFWAEIFNVPKAETYGMEASADWNVLENLRLRASLGLLRTKILEEMAPGVGLEGKQFQRSPKVTASGSVDWQPVDRLHLNASVRHNGGYFSDDFNTPARHIGKATRIDARAGFDVGQVTLLGYVRNLLDAFDMTYLNSPTVGVAADPREFGVGLEARF